MTLDRVPNSLRYTLNVIHTIMASLKHPVRVKTVQSILHYVVSEIRLGAKAAINRLFINTVWRDVPTLSALELEELSHCTGL